MRFFSAAVIAAVVVVSGCSTDPDWPNPNLDKKQFTRLSELVYSLECELGEAVANVPDKYQHLANQDALATLNLKVIETPSPSGGVTLAIPVGVSVVTLGGSGKASFTATRSMEVRIPINPKDVRSCSIADQKKLGFKRIESGLGLAEWIEELVTLLETAKRLPEYVSYSTSFQVVNTPSGSLVFANTRSGGPSGTVTLGNSGKRDILHSVSLTIKAFEDRTPRRRTSRGVDPELERAAESFMLREAISRISE